MKLLKDFGAFWYDFIIGDDWKIAVGVVIALAAGALLLTQNVFSDHVLAVVGTVLIVALFTVSLTLDVRSE